MKTFRELAEETTAGDVAPVSSKLGSIKKKPKPCNTKKCKDAENKKMTEKVQTPADYLRDSGIKVKSVEMDEDSYVILLFKKSDTKEAKDILEKDGYEITIVGSMLYVS